ncbi:MAG: hypothetical protein WC437_05635 [Patescibacteria group bacterium]
MPTPIKTPREILMEIRQYEMDCGCVDENCPSCAKRIDQALQALDAYYKARVRVDEEKILNILHSYWQGFELMQKGSMLEGKVCQIYDKLARAISSHSTQIIKIEGER